MAARTEFNKRRVIQYIRIPRIRKLCPQEQLHFTDNTIFLIYKTDDDTYPDIAKITTKFYNKPMLEYYGGHDTVESLDRFLQFNIKERQSLADMVEELSKLSTVKVDKIEEIFEKYKNILKPTCELYKLCYYIPITFYTLDIRIYKGKPTFLNRSLTVVGIIRWLRGEIPKEEVLNMWPKVLETVEPTERIEKLSCVSVKGHQRRLKADRFKNKKGSTISVKPHVKILKTTDKETGK